MAFYLSQGPLERKNQKMFVGLENILCGSWVSGKEQIR